MYEIIRVGFNAQCSLFVYSFGIIIWDYNRNDRISFELDSRRILSMHKGNTVTTLVFNLQKIESRHAVCIITFTYSGKWIIKWYILKIF